MPKVPYLYEVNGKLVTENGSLIPICSLLPSLTVVYIFIRIGQEKVVYVYCIYRISANSFRGNYSFLNLALCSVTFGHSTYRCENYSREKTIQERKLFGEIRYLEI